MRVLIITPYFKPALIYGGPVRSVDFLARGLMHAGCEVVVATTNAFGDKNCEVAAHRFESGVSVYTFNRLFARESFLRNFFLSTELIWYLNKNIKNFDIVHAQGIFIWPTVLCYLMANRFGVPFVISPRGSLSTWGLMQRRLKKLFFLQLIDRRVLSSALCVHYTANYEAADVPIWARGLKSIVIPNALSFEEIGSTERGRKRLNCDSDEFIVGYVGRIHPKKRIDLLIRATAGACQSRKVKLVIVGNGDPKVISELSRLVSELGVAERITFTGQLDGTELIDTYASFDVFTLPSHEENFGNVVVEALAQDTRVAVSPGVALAPWLLEHGVGDVVSGTVQDWTKFLLSAHFRSHWPAEFHRVACQSHFDYRRVGVQMFEKLRFLLDSKAGRLLS